MWVSLTAAMPMPEALALFKINRNSPKSTPPNSHRGSEGEAPAAGTFGFRGYGGMLLENLELEPG
jgi:hypothetical protein